MPAQAWIAVGIVAAAAIGYALHPILEARGLDRHLREQAGHPATERSGRIDLTDVIAQLPLATDPPPPPRGSLTLVDDQRRAS